VAATARDSVKDAEDQASLAEREALERVLRVEVENVMVSASARKDAKGFVRRTLSLRASLRWSIGPKRCLRGSAESNLRSSPFYRLGTLSYSTPSMVPHG
jgi:hypothetical protein